MKQEIALTVDAVIFAEEEKELYLLVIKRKNEPFKDKWALPGGFIDNEELVEDACLRELKEETSLAIQALRMVGIYDKVDRDPRQRTVSIAYTKKLLINEKVESGDDAKDAKWIKVKEITDLAFDHEHIVDDALKTLQITP